MKMSLSEFQFEIKILLTSNQISNFRVGEALIFGSWMLGQALAYAPNVNAAVIAASRIMKLLKRVPNMSNPQPNPYKDYEVSSAFNSIEIS